MRSQRRGSGYRDEIMILIGDRYLLDEFRHAAAAIGGDALGFRLALVVVDAGLAIHANAHL